MDKKMHCGYQRNNRQKHRKVVEYMQRQHLKVMNNRTILGKNNYKSGQKRSLTPGMKMEIKKQYTYTEPTQNKYGDILIKEPEDYCTPSDAFVELEYSNDTIPSENIVKMVTIPPAVFRSYFGSRLSLKKASESLKRLVEQAGKISINSLQPQYYLHQVKIICKECDFEKVQETMNKLIHASQTSKLEEPTTLVHMWHGEHVLVTVAENGIPSEITLAGEHMNLLVVYAKSGVDEIKRMLDDDVSSIQRCGEKKAGGRVVHGVKYRLWGEVKMKESASAHSLLLIAGEKECLLGSDFFVTRPESCKNEGLNVCIEWHYRKLKTMRVTLKPRVNSTKIFRLPKFLEKVEIEDKWCECRLINSDILEIDLSYVDQMKFMKRDMEKVVKGKINKTSRVIQSIDYGYQEKRCTEAHIECMEKFIKDHLKSNDIPGDDFSIKIPDVNHDYPVLQTNVTIFDRIRGNYFVDAIKKSVPYIMEKLTMESMYFTRAHIGCCAVYNVVKGGIVTLKETMHQKRGIAFHVDVSTDPVDGASINVDLCAKQYQDAIKMRTVLQNIIKPEKFSQITDAEFHFMTGSIGKQVCADLEENYQVVIKGERSCLCLLIYGPPQMKTKVIEKLDLFLRAIRNSTTVVNLSSYGCEELVLCVLEKTYGRLLWKLKKKHDVDEMYVDVRQHVLHILGNNDTVSKVKVHLEVVAETLINSEIKKPNTCVACLSTTDTEAFILDICGHVYCKACIQVQIDIAIKDRTFPIFCAAENCEMPICLSDIKLILCSTTRGMDAFIQAAVGLLVTRTQERYRFCPIPDCRMIYYIDNGMTDSRFACSLCKVDCCRVCHSVYHEGQTCLAYKFFKNMCPKLGDWMKEDPVNRDICPKCRFGIEKNGGCPCVICIVCKTYICWKCKKYFDTGILTYKHIGQNCVDP